MSAPTQALRSPELLSRKGMAAPSAEPETRANMVGTLGAPVAPAAPLDNTTRPQPRLGPARGSLADWATPAPVPTGARDRRGQVAGKRARVSLRLDADRHARLKLVATQRNCTLQSLFTEAIDALFTRHAPDLHRISARLRKSAAVTASGGETKRGARNTESRNGPSRFR